jgi:hypothetical protein
MLTGLSLPIGAVRTVTVPNPAPGVRWDYIVPAGYQVLLLGVQYLLTTSAVAGNRFPGFQFERLGPVFFAIHCGSSITATKNYICVWLPGCSFIQTVTVGAAPLSGTHQMTLPYPIILDPGDSLHGAVVGLGAADQFSDIYLYYLAMPLTQ